ncbi:MAG: alpha/beta hydrolase family protein [Caldimonas sp.]
MIAHRHAWIAMTALEARPSTLRVDATDTVSALLLVPAKARACYVFGHGAGAGMKHPFMTAFAEGLAARDVATLRYQFPYMERGSKRVDPPGLAHATVRAAVAEAGRQCPGLPLFAGGKSFGGRMTSQAQAKEPLPGVLGLAFVGFPLHPAGKPGVDRAAHLSQVKVPMLFLQGSRDELAELALIGGVVDGLGALASLVTFDDADHSFHVRARSGGNDAQVREAMLDATVAWIGNLAAPA